MLAAENSIASRRIDSNTVPRIPASNTETILHRFTQQPLRKTAATAKVTARYTTAIPRSAHKNAGVTIIEPVILKNAAITPMIRLAAKAITVQSGLPLLHDVDI